MTVEITPADLAPFATIEPAKAEAMIADALAMAVLLAPCIAEADFKHPDAAKAVLRGAVLRWNEAGSGSVQQLTAGPYGAGLDTRIPRRGMFQPSEIEQLQSMCRDSTGGGAYAVDTYLDAGQQEHADICSLRFGAQYCSCGAVLTNAAALWEGKAGW
jgi:hypothetical protein